MTKIPPRRRTRAQGVRTSNPAQDVCNGLHNDSPRISIDYVLIDALTPPSRPLKKHSQRGLTALRASIRTAGIVRPILVDAHLSIVAGHGVWLAARDLGYREVPVVRAARLTKDQLAAYAIADNQIANLNPWDDEVLCLALGDLNDLSLAGAFDFSLELTGFSAAEIDKILDVQLEEDSGQTMPEPEPEAVAVTRLGNLWLMGNHQLYCGDALEDRSYRALLGEERAQIVVADSPYNVRISGNVSGLGKHSHREFVMASGEMSREQFTEFLRKAMELQASYSVDGSIHYQFMDWRHMREMLDAGHTVYSELKNLCVWAKDNAGMGSFYRSQHELAFVWKKGMAKHINNFGLGETGRHRSNLWCYSGGNGFHKHRDEELAMHGTVKNLSMIADAIRDCSHRGHIVLDPFGGSGTTLIAAEKTNRRGRLIELDPLYCDVIIRRWQKLTGDRAVLEATGESFDQIACNRLDVHADEEA